MTLAIDCVPVMTIDKREPDDIPDEDKNNAPSGKEITEKGIQRKCPTVIAYSEKIDRPLRNLIVWHS